MNYKNKYLKTLLLTLILNINFIFGMEKNFLNYINKYLFLINNPDDQFLKECKIFYDKNNSDNVNYKMQEYKIETIENYCNRDDLKIIGNFKINSENNLLFTTNNIINKYTKNEADKIKNLKNINPDRYTLEKENFKNKRLPFILNNIKIIINNKEYIDYIPSFNDPNYIQKYKEDIIKENFPEEIIDNSTIKKLKDKINN